MSDKKRITARGKRSPIQSGNRDKFICFNKECKLRKQKTCKGFEGCPGYLGK